MTLLWRSGAWVTFWGFFQKRGFAAEGGGGVSELKWGVSRDNIGWCSKITCFLNGLSPPQKALSIAPSGSEFLKGFVNAFPLASMCLNWRVWPAQVSWHIYT